jgi:hypothetical protein
MSRIAICRRAAIATLTLAGVVAAVFAVFLRVVKPPGKIVVAHFGSRAALIAEVYEGNLAIVHMRSDSPGFLRMLKSRTSANWDGPCVPHEPFDLVRAEGAEMIDYSLPNAPTVFGRGGCVSAPLWAHGFALLSYPALTVIRARLGRSALRRRAGLCVRCGYNLTGLTVARCPECGTPFHPAWSLVTAPERLSDQPPER